MVYRGHSLSFRTLTLVKASRITDLATIQPTFLTTQPPSRRLSKNSTSRYMPIVCAVAKPWSRNGRHKVGGPGAMFRHKKTIASTE